MVSHFEGSESRSKCRRMWVEERRFETNVYLERRLLNLMKIEVYAGGHYDVPSRNATIAGPGRAAVGNSTQGLFGILFGTP